MLITTKFKTQGTYVYQAIQVTTEMERIVSAYIKHVRPYCFSKGGVLKSVSVAESAPLFVTPLTGGRIDKLSPYVISHTLLLWANGFTVQDFDPFFTPTWMICVQPKRGKCMKAVMDTRP